MHHRSRTSTVFLVFAFLAACRNKATERSTTSSNRSIEASASASSASSALTPTKLTADAPAPAFLSAGGSTYRIDAGKLDKMDGVSIVDAELSPDGILYVLTQEGVTTYRGGSLQPLPSFGARSIAFGPKGELWAVGYTSVARFDGTAWKETHIPEDCVLCNRIGVDSKGTVYVGGSDKVDALTGEKWSTIDPTTLFGAVKTDDVGLEVTPSIYGFDRVGDQLFIAANVGMLSMDDKHTKLELPVANQLSRYLGGKPGVTANGELAGYSASSYFVTNGKGQTATHGLDEVGLAATRISAFAVDGQGRRYVGSDGGFVIQSKDGKPLLALPPGTLPGVVDDVFVFAKGPELPAKAPDVVKGSLKGRLMVNGKPMKNADVEMCDSPSPVLTGGATPCSGKPAVARAKTDEAGVFHMTDVLLGAYEIAFKDDKGWSTTLGGYSYGGHLTQGQELDVGDISINN